MADELLVAGIVRAYGEQLLPRDSESTERAVNAAVRANLDGASVIEACRHGRRLLESQRRHPSCGRRLARMAAL
ncbi:MAG: hypothetical protein ABL966_01875 [Acidimicrobiales bacterium]